jgi:hypothetical protein
MSSLTLRDLGGEERAETEVRAQALALAQDAAGGHSLLVANLAARGLPPACAGCAVYPSAQR